MPGHFLLTNLLLDDLKKTGGGEDGEARVVVVASAIHDPDSNKKWMRSKFGDFKNVITSPMMY